MCFLRLTQTSRWLARWTTIRWKRRSWKKTLSSPISLTLQVPTMIRMLPTIKSSIINWNRNRSKRVKAHLSIALECSKKMAFTWLPLIAFTKWGLHLPMWMQRSHKGWSRSKMKSNHKATKAEVKWCSNRIGQLSRFSAMGLMTAMINSSTSSCQDHRKRNKMNKWRIWRCWTIKNTWRR